MRVLVIGASGAIGIRIVSQLREHGHQVTGSCHAPQKTAQVRAAGADPVVLDALDGQAVRAAVATARPEAIIYQATALSMRRSPRRAGSRCATAGSTVPSTTAWSSPCAGA